MGQDANGVTIPRWAIGLFVTLLANIVVAGVAWGAVSKQVDLLQQSFYRLEDRVNHISPASGVK